MRRRALVVGVLAGAMLLAWVALALADAPSGTPSHYATTTASSAPTVIAVGPDGNLWFTESAADPSQHFHVATIAPSGTVAESPFALQPTAVVDGVSGTATAGSMWTAFGDSNGAEVVAMNTLGHVTYASDMMWIGVPGGETIDSAGHVWVTLPAPRRIDELTPPATHPAIFPLSTSAQSIAALGTTVWATEPSAGQLISISGTTVTPHALPPGVSGTLGEIIAGPDGNLYAGLRGATGNPSYVLRITPAGTITPLPLPAGPVNPNVLAFGPDGLIWMAGGGVLASMSTSGVVTVYAGELPATDTIGGISPDPTADALWLTDTTASTIYRVALAPPPPPPPPPLTTPTTTATATTAPSAPPVLSAALDPTSAMTTTGVTLAGTIAEPAGSAATTVTYQFEYGTSTEYGATTPPATTTATRAPSPSARPSPGSIRTPPTTTGWW